jgi:hypothetical protein
LRPLLGVDAVFDAAKGRGCRLDGYLKRHVGAVCGEGGELLQPGVLVLEVLAFAGCGEVGEESAVEVFVERVATGYLDIQSHGLRHFMLHRAGCVGRLFCSGWIGLGLCCHVDDDGAASGAGAFAVEFLAHEAVGECSIAFYAFLAACCASVCSRRHCEVVES